MLKRGDKVELVNHTLAGKVVTVHEEYPTYVEVLVQYETGGLVYLEALSFNQVMTPTPKRKSIYKLSELYI